MIGSAAMTVGEWYASSSFGGWLIFAIVEGSMLLIILAALFGSRKQFKVTGVFIGSLVALLVGIVISLWIAGYAFSFIVPK